MLIFSDEKIQNLWRLALNAKRVLKAGTRVRFTIIGPDASEEEIEKAKEYFAAASPEIFLDLIKELRHLECMRVYKEQVRVSYFQAHATIRNMLGAFQSLLPSLYEDPVAGRERFKEHVLDLIKKVNDDVKNHVRPVSSTDLKDGEDFIPLPEAMEESRQLELFS